MNAPGQITRETSFGAALFKVVSENRHINVIIDVGTWNGLGTTKILVEATAQNPLAQIYSIEANMEMFQIAKQNWPSCPNKLHLLYGKFGEKIMGRQEVLSHPLFHRIKEHYDLYYEQDVKDFYLAPLALLPRYADLVVLDGGEFNGEGDLDTALSLRPKMLALDDIHVIKNYDNMLRLIRSGEWTIIARGSEKTGWAILQRASIAEDFLSRYIAPEGFGC